MAGEPMTNSVVDLKDTWLDLELGGSWVSAQIHIYMEHLLKNFGSTVDTSYRVDAGIRHNF